jgi:hypothetical protein
VLRGANRVSEVFARFHKRILSACRWNRGRGYRTVSEPTSPMRGRKSEVSAIPTPVLGASEAIVGADRSAGVAD